ncbi:MAG TPA: hypothetical protein VK498_04845, partial [Ferruginibacter sp.]|nr:hypothetical protein [Ferruginibacter sp.]
MQIHNKRVELIIEPATSSRSLAPLNLKKQLKSVGIEIEVMPAKAKLPLSKKGAKGIMGVKNDRVYIKTNIRDNDMNPWDVAHLSIKATGNQAAFIEPDMLHEFVVDTNLNAAHKRKDLKSVSGTKAVEDNGYDPDWYPRKNIIWHLGNDYSQLKTAREAVENVNYQVRIGHIDTGYDPTHTIIPATVRQNKLQRNFVEGENPLVAIDPRTTGLLRMPGHGTGTAGILYGGKIKLATEDGVFNDFLGGAPH